MSDMSIRFGLLFSAALFASPFAAGVADAAIVSFSGPNSSLNVAPEIIDAPDKALDSEITNKGAQAFNERQFVTLTDDVLVDGGSIAAGSRVDSHMIFFNLSNADSGISRTHGSSNNKDLALKITFTGDILGIMTDSDGALEYASTGQLGSPTTEYPAGTFARRGLESGTPDKIWGFEGNTLWFSMHVKQPGDWIRVVTASVPVPAAGWLFMAALGGLGALRVGRKSNG
ncbi:VPLPA-CTERM sorting domain-containing protein [Qingshengfaniella alkalisoli]|uniref:Secreted protein n=1 Tax=Qingshengfaniella alkalisoli TaxID=2599296 RepID=A0A5B8JAY1_9RHOB|nr:VPLPA-CTERM sorting domain-containing protein [Qingshengfaniella alkalisoli]QDY71320.1 hypothetical protein FPZ52_16580 [Qingshengfaniella alkalisoli]